jgi:hypothetical protein
MNKKIIVLVVIVLIIVVAAVYILSNLSKTNANQTVSANTTNNTTSVNNQTSSQSISQTNSMPNVTISAEQAQKAAIMASKELGRQTVVAGTPTLIKWTQNDHHTWVWNVQVYDAKTNQSAGEWYVDAYTGKVIINE